MYIEYMDILIGENLSSNQGAYMELIYCSVRSSSAVGGDVFGDPNNNISITKAA